MLPAELSATQKPMGGFDVPVVLPGMGAVMAGGA
jgi:hypothetical protein